MKIINHGRKSFYKSRNKKAMTRRRDQLRKLHPLELISYISKNFNLSYMNGVIKVYKNENRS